MTGAAAPVALSGLWAVVPVKRFARAKTRLAATLGVAERAALAEAMFNDLLELLASVGTLAGIVVVTADPSAAMIAAGSGAIVLPDEDEAGTNPAVARGLDWLAGRGAAGALVLPADIPFARRAEIERALALLHEARVVLVPAARDGGTNILGLAPPSAMTPAYGPDSCARHMALARAAGLKPRLLSLAGAGRDVDVADDLACLPEAISGRHTRGLLALLGSRQPIRVPAITLAPRHAAQRPDVILQQKGLQS